MHNEDKATKKRKPLEARWPGETDLPSSLLINIKSNFDLARKSNFDLATQFKCQEKNRKALFIPMFKILPYYL